MAELTEGERQRREVNTYNLFYSSITARANPSLAAHGARMVMQFPVIEDRPNEVSAAPDFVLYDGSTCILAEIKSGNNINKRHINQMRECAAVDIETAEEALNAAQVSEKTKHDGAVDSVEPLIVYQDLDEAYIQAATEESTSFESRLDELTDYAVLMTQDYGGSLRVLEGEFREEGVLQRLLSRGVSLPKNPPDAVMLTEEIEPEILSIAITDIWGDKALDHDDGVQVSRTEIRDYFAPQRNIDPITLDLTLKFLEELGASDSIENGTYEFTREHMGAILDVESQVMEESVKDYLHGSEQYSLEEF